MFTKFVFTVRWQGRERTSPVKKKTMPKEGQEWVSVIDMWQSTKQTMDTPIL